ncbi:twin transmembrane helix small protein [Pseudooceanicola sp.]|uniref:twin transmembrane helix small protein n=1 Tax=Pseudooceanicola sp. TaxID=1914328 RepID=UPI002611B1B3|nr:twin transmembrane helix small protein [Pseudooceanicola sp.]MDF1857070.1 twin transmembrane helix small protein [Pseudooceanicola sp.]
MANDPLFYVVIAAVLLVAGILMFGIGGFARGVDGKKSNKVMQWRIAAQFVAVVLIVLYVWLRGKS